MERLIDAIRQGGGLAEHERIPVLWSEARLSHLRRVAAGQIDARSEAERDLAVPLLRCTDGRFNDAEREIVALLANNLEVCRAHEQTFISFLQALFTVQRFDLVAELLRTRFGFARTLEIDVERDGPGLGRVRWDIQPSGAHRFVFDALTLQYDHTPGKILAFQWEFPLFAHYARLTDQQAGSVIINLEDLGQTPGLAWSDGRPDYFLIPDCNFVATEGYRDARQVLHERRPAWHDRQPTAMWRGSSTGIPSVPGDWRSLERVRLCELARQHEHTGLIDAGLSTIVQIQDPDAVRQIEESGLARDPIAWADWGLYKYQIDVDGNSNAWTALFQRLLTGSPVLKVESSRGIRQWYYDDLIPWRNYVPVAPDMSDLIDKISWLRHHDAVARRIGEAGLALAEHLTYQHEMDRGAAVILAAFRYFNGRPEGVGPFGLYNERLAAISPPAVENEPAAAQGTDVWSLPERPDLGQRLMRVESLGVSCELGLIQRHCRVEPLGLFRFGYTPLDGLIVALEADFAGAAEPSEIELIDLNQEWVTRHKRYGFEFHTALPVAQTPEEMVRRQMSTHFGFLARKLLDELKVSEKLFFYRPEEPGGPGPGAHALLAAMQKFGHPVLCWVDMTEDQALAGTAKWVLPGQMMVGYLDRYAPVRFAAAAPFDTWLRLVSSGLDLLDAFRSNELGGTRRITGNSGATMAQFEPLDTTGIRAGTDKSSLGWDYLRHYEEFFLPLRDREFNLIEIGVGGGNSLNTWKTFFTRATIVGVDIDEATRRLAGERIIIEIGSPADADFLDSVLNRFPPMIVIDDGSHQADHIMFSFRYVFSHLAPGGWYVIEDLNITGGTDYVPLTPHAFFARTAEALMQRRPGDHPDPDILADIDRIDIAPGVVFIRKRDAAALLQRREELPSIVDQTVLPNNFYWLSKILMNEIGDLDAAEAAARRAVQLHPMAAVYHLGLSLVLERRGDIMGAIEAARMSAVTEPDWFDGHLQLAKLFAHSGDIAGAAMSFSRAAAVAPPVLHGFIEAERRNSLGAVA